MKRFGKYKIISLLSTLMFLGGTKMVNAIFPSWEEIWMSIGNTLIFLSSQILRIAGLLFNCVMEYTINFATLVTNSGVVDIGWGIFRDLSNMIFIFILLAISIATILGIQPYSAKQLLTKVILVALLINFSLFATKVIIDAANVFTIGFYNATIENAGGAAEGAVGGADWNKGVTAIFAGALNLHTIFKADQIDSKAKDTFGSDINGTSILLVAVLGSVLLIVTAFVFFAGSVLLMKRIVVLMFLMMLSPLAFLGMILPATSGYSKQWWQTLFKEAFYAPVFMMFIYVVTSAISSDAFRKNISKAASLKGSGFSNLATGGDVMLILFNFILIIGLMLASIITASKLGANGAKGMMKMGENLNKWGQGKIKAGAGAATFGVGGRLARKTIGGASQWGADKIAGSDWAAKGGAGSKLALKTLRGAGDSSFDVRNTEMGKKMGVGTGVKGGYKTKRDEVEKKEKVYAKSLTGDTTDASGNTISKTEAYAQKRGSKEPSGIWGTMIKGSGIQGRKQAGAALIKEYTQKEELKVAKDKLQDDPKLKKARLELRRITDNLKDIREIDGKKPMEYQKTELYEAEDEVKKIEAALKEGVNEIKERIKKADAKKLPNLPSETPYPKDKK